MKSALRIFVSRAKAPFSTGLVLLLFFVQALAASPVLHLDVHDDADSADHTCAVKTISQGQIDLSDPGATLDLPTVVYCEAPIESAPVLDSLFFSVGSSRGPPLA
jgi:hypothetical protein